MGHWMTIAPQMRRRDGKVGEPMAAAGDAVNCVCLVMAGTARSAQKDREYFRTAFAIADHLGWAVHDDTDSGAWVTREWALAEDPPPKPWWRLW